MQLTTFQTNIFRICTKVRWVIEAIEGIFKRFFNDIINN